MYIAVTYIGGRYVPGEVIDDDIPAEQLEWLIKSGAVRSSAYEPEEAADAPLPEAAAEEQPEEEQYEQAYDADDDAREIDAMDGIVKPKAKKKTAKGGGKK